MARMSDYEQIIFDTKNKVFELEKKVDYLEQENQKLRVLLNDKLVDFQMDIEFLKKRR